MRRLQSVVHRAFALKFHCTSAQRAASTMAEPLVLGEMEGGIAELRLNRPKALNSLNTEMVTLAYQHYSAWTSPGSGVRAIILSGTGDKAFCAGGDVKYAAQQVAAGNTDEAMTFFKREYLLDASISQLQLPHISLLNGITMGGGAGVSMHGHFRVATEKTVFAMPECAIGLFPDVGMMAILPHLPSNIGAYLALTGARLTGVQVKEAGLATHYIPSTHLPHIMQRLHEAGPAASDPSQVNSILLDIESESAKGQGLPAAQSLWRLLPIIDSCFGHNTVGQIVAALQAEKAERPWCEETLKQLQRGSPLSAAITMSYLHRSRSQGWGPIEVLQQDCLLCGHFMAGDGDFYEGVRARLIDKDDQPVWKHRSHEEVPQELVDRFFTARSDHDVINLRQLLASKQQAPQHSHL